jgi:hypothetical protein
MSNPSAPLFTHDCDRCTFLGTETDPEGGCLADLYHCLDIIGPTVIARWSNEGRDYTSGMVFARPGTILGIAKDRAEAKGLDVTVIR